MANLKVLPLNWWMVCDDDFRGGSIAEVSNCKEVHEVVYNRPGLYKLKDDCWFETNKGEAYRYSVNDFNWQLKTKNAEDLRHEDVEGLKYICKSKFATKQQKDMWYMYRHMLELRCIRRDVAKYRRSVIGE